VINKAFRVENIYYDFDKSNIREDAKPELDKLVRIMKENMINVELGSHTDCRGSFEYNDKLSQSRAESAVNYIISTGIEKARIAAKGYGERQLINTCADGVNCTPEEHQANRRTEFKVTGFNPVANTEQFDYSKFTEGQEIEFSSLPAGFLSQCK
jgi:outer membrane protein OmpA-like peptidoglycan-associated protein